MQWEVQASFYVHFGLYRQKAMIYFPSSTIANNFYNLNDANAIWTF